MYFHCDVVRLRCSASLQASKAYTLSEYTSRGVMESPDNAEAKERLRSAEGRLQLNDSRIVGKISANSTSPATLPPGAILPGHAKIIGMCRFSSCTMKVWPCSPC